MTYHIIFHMDEKIVRLRPKRPPSVPSRDELVQKIRALATETTNLRFDHPHVQQRLAERGVTMRQVLTVLRQGNAISGPTLDEHGDWRIKLKKRVAGRRVQVVVAVKEEHLVVVTAI